MARPGRKRKNPEMMLTILRTAFLAYVRVLLCLQGMFLGFCAWGLWLGREPYSLFSAPLGRALLFIFLGLAQGRFTARPDTPQSATASGVGRADAAGAAPCGVTR